MSLYRQTPARTLSLKPSIAADSLIAIALQLHYTINLCLQLSQTPSRIHQQQFNDPAKAVFSTIGLFVFLHFDFTGIPLHSQQPDTRGVYTRNLIAGCAVSDV